MWTCRRQGDGKGILRWPCCVCIMGWELVLLGSTAGQRAGGEGAVCHPPARGDAMFLLLHFRVQVNVYQCKLRFHGIPQCLPFMRFINLSFPLWDIPVSSGDLCILKKKKKCKKNNKLYQNGKKRGNKNKLFVLVVCKPVCTEPLLWVQACSLRYSTVHPRQQLWAHYNQPI